MQNILSLSILLTFGITGILQEDFVSHSRLETGAETETLSRTARFGQSSRPRILALYAFDQNQSISSSDYDINIDTTQDTCDAEVDPPLLEEFYDTRLALDVMNVGGGDAMIQSARFAMRNVAGRRKFRSPRTIPMPTTVLPSDETTRIAIFLFRSENGEKFLPGTSNSLAGLDAFRKVRVVLRGRDSNGKRFRIRSRIEVSIGNVDRCRS